MTQRVLELGDFYVSDFVDHTPRDSNRYSLDLWADAKYNAARLHRDQVAPKQSMWGKYWYRSGVNQSMRTELAGIVQEVLARKNTYTCREPVWLDIASNDGTLLSSVPQHFQRYGIDPCDSSFSEQARKHGTILEDYFSKSAFESICPGGRADVITFIAAFYLIDDPEPIVQDLYEVLSDDGVLVLQLSYTPLMIRQLAFDNICHEHIYYWSLGGIKSLFENHGFRIVDCALNDTNGGSMRVYLQKDTASLDSFGTTPLRDVCAMRVDSLLDHERFYDLRSPTTWLDFAQRLEMLRTDVVGFIRQERASGKSIWGYGASTKGNTLLQYFGLDQNDLDAIAERNPAKYGLRTLGSDIPIRSEEEMRAAKPDYLLIMPWAFIGEFRTRESEYLQNGGALIVPCPQFEVIATP